MSNEAIGSRAAVLQAMRSLAGFLVFIGVAMFLPAGRWGWTRGWLFLAAFLRAHHPESRLPAPHQSRDLRRPQPDPRERKTWDKVILSLLLPSMLFEIVLAALDSGRFHWSRVPAWATALGYVFLVFGYLLSVWAYRFNKFAEPGVRVQKERGRQVIDGGPYALVRHPGVSRRALP